MLLNYVYCRTDNDRPLPLTGTVLHRPLTTAVKLAQKKKQTLHHDPQGAEEFP